MPHTYTPERCLRIPTDSRLWASVFFGASLGMLIVDSLDRDGSLLAVWSVFLALAGVAVTCAGLHAYSRRVILDVMSWEHRQLGMFGDDTSDDPQLLLVGDSQS